MILSIVYKLICKMFRKSYQTPLSIAKTCLASEISPLDSDAPLRVSAQPKSDLGEKSLPQLADPPYFELREKFK